MIRDTLEMVPVAVVLAVVLSFGIRPGHTRVPMPLERPAYGMAGMTERENSATARFASSGLATRESEFTRVQSCAASAHESSIVASHPVNVPVTAPGSQPTVPPRIDSASVAELAEFLPRQTRVIGVPYFTSRDLGVQGRLTPPVNPLVLASRPATRVSASTSSPTAVLSQVPVDGLRININEARLEELVRVPGIGRARAQLILDQRPDRGYRSWDEIDALPGFGPATLGTLRQHAGLD